MEELPGYLGDVPGGMFGGPLSPSRQEAAFGEVGCFFGELGVVGMCGEEEIHTGLGRGGLLRMK